MSKSIVVLHRGWVVVGEVKQQDNHIVITNAFVVRKWGTTKGLGQLALEGPTEETVLDKCGVVRAHELAVVLSMDCALDKWA